jgi:hypothetical protein
MDAHFKEKFAALEERVAAIEKTLRSLMKASPRLRLPDLLRKMKLRMNAAKARASKTVGDGPHGVSSKQVQRQLQKEYLAITQEKKKP